MRSFFTAHALLIMLAIAAVFTFDWLMINRKRLNMTWYSALILTLLHVAAGVGCVKFFALAEAGFNAEKAGSMSLFGAIFFLPVFYYLGSKLFKRSVAEVFDIFTIPMAATLMCARVNCLVAGCCLGSPIGDSGARWPTREAELVFYLIFLAVLIPLVLKKKGAGRAFPLFMLAYGAFRAVCECFRESSAYPGFFHLSHLWALISALIGAIVLILLSGSRRRTAVRSARAANRSNRRNQQ